MSDIKNALAEKRKKLDELKKKREARKAATPVTPVKPTTPTSLRSPTGASSADELLASVNVLVNTPSAGDTLSEAVGSAPIQHSTSGGFKVKLKSVNALAKQILPEITILPVETPKYTRETQTDFDQNSYSKWQQEEQDEKQRRMEAAVAKKKAEEQKQKELEDKIKKDTEDDEKKRRELNQQQKKQILESKEFLDFFSRSSKFVERALTQNDRFDITIDYKIAGKKDDDKKASSILSSCETFFDKNRVYDRPVTSIDWSPSFKELICCSYAQKEDVMSLDPDGLVLVWNMHMNERPEYSFYCQSAVLTAQWHPGNPKMIIGGTYSGQIVLWDTREKNTPVARTSLSQGHTHPLFSLSAIPSVNLLHNIISVSTDGRLCIWNDNDLLEPHTTLDLSWQDKEVVTTCLGFAGRDTNTVVLGSDEGNLYRARLYDKPGVFDAIQAHHAPITQVQFHPSYKNSPRDIKDLFLTSSYDWTVKLWSAKTSRCLYTFESAKDYVYDVQWSPIHPSLFVSGDGTGFVDFWDLNKDTEVPIHHVNVLEQPGVDKKLQKDRAVSRLKWSDDGKKLALGSSEGQLKVYEVSSEISKATDEDASNFYEKMKSATIE